MAFLERFLSRILSRGAGKHGVVHRVAFREAARAAQTTWNEGWEREFVAPHEPISEENRQNSYVDRDMKLSVHMLKKDPAEAERIAREAASRAESVQNGETRRYAFQNLACVLRFRGRDLEAKEWDDRAKSQ